MTKASQRHSARFGRDATEMMIAAPQVIAHRLTRMATAGALPSARDQQEFHQMSSEKYSAFWESWQAMAMHAWKLQQAAFVSTLRAWGAMSMGLRPMAPMTLIPTLAKMQADTMSVMVQGLSPVRRRAVANAKRLAALR
jgi:hypothetical protein